MNKWLILIFAILMPWVASCDSGKRKSWVSEETKRFIDDEFEAICSSLESKIVCGERRWYGQRFLLKSAHITYLSNYTESIIQDELIARGWQYIGVSRDRALTFCLRGLEASLGDVSEKKYLDIFSSADRGFCSKKFGVQDVQRH